MKKYTLDAWFYIPSSLGVNEKDYSVEQFFANLRTLTRFGSAHLPLSSIVDQTCDLSPLVRIRRELKRIPGSGEPGKKKILYELRSLANIYASELAAGERWLIEELENRKPGKAAGKAGNFLDDMEAVLNQWSQLQTRVNRTEIRDELLQAFGWCDEAICISTETFLFRLYKPIEKALSGQKSGSGACTDRLLKMIMDLRKHRKKANLINPEPDSPPEEVEGYLYRQSVLKKWMQSVLYLSHRESTTTRNMNQILAGIAAAVAMSFAVITSILAERFFPGQSLSWAVALIVAYIFKDRIKEGLRNLLNHTFPSLVNDERVRLTDQTSGRVIGKVSSRVRFMKSSDAPESVKDLVGEQDRPFRRILPEADLLFFRRQYRFRTGILRRYHLRLDNLTDIVRLNLSTMLLNMDDPDKDIPIFIDDKPVLITGHRIYPLDLIVELSGRKGKQVDRFAYRLILDRTGLQRIENR